MKCSNAAEILGEEKNNSLSDFVVQGQTTFYYSMLSEFTWVDNWMEWNTVCLYGIYIFVKIYYAWKYCFIKIHISICQCHLPYIFHFQRRLPFDWISFLMLWYLLDGAALSGSVWKWIWIVSQTVQTNPSPPSIPPFLFISRGKIEFSASWVFAGGHWWWPRPWRQQWWWLCCWLRIWQWYFIGNGMLMIFSIRKKCAVAKFVLWPKKKVIL